MLGPLENIWVKYFSLCGVGIVVEFEGTTRNVRESSWILWKRMSCTPAIMIPFSFFLFLFFFFFTGQYKFYFDKKINNGLVPFACFFCIKRMTQIGWFAQCCFFFYPSICEIIVVIVVLKILSICAREHIIWSTKMECGGYLTYDLLCYMVTPIKEIWYTWIYLYKCMALLKIASGTFTRIFISLDKFINVDKAKLSHKIVSS